MSGEYTRGPWRVLFEDGDVISIRPGGFEAKSILRTNGDVNCNLLAPDAFRIVACVNALDGIPEPEKFIRLAKELIDKECLRDGCPQIWNTQEED